MKLHYFLMAALLAGSPVVARPVKRAPATAVKSDPAALKAASDKLAELVTPEAAIPQQADKLVGSMLQTLLEKDAGFNALNSRYPGMTDAITQRVRPIMLESSRSTLPLYRAELSSLYAANMTLAQANAAVAFFSSADGPALLSSANSNLTYKSTAKAISGGGEAQTSDLRQDVRSAAQQTVAELSPAQRSRVGAFFASPAGQKIIAIGPQKAQLDQKWFNYSPPGLEQRVSLATVEAMLDHIGKTDPDMEKRMRDALVAKGVLPKS